MLKKGSFKGLSINFIKKIGLQLVQALKTLESCDIIHCDLKPENILLMHITRPNIKLIDLGSSCFCNKRLYTYIQSRFYRAPEIILGIPYTPSIDMWSLGCVLTELYTGIPLFPGESETDQLMCMMEILDVPSADVINSGSRSYLFFEPNGNPKITANSRGKKRIPGSRSLRNVFKGADDGLFALVEACLRWNPENRIKPKDALEMDWFKEQNIQNSRALTYKHKKISLEDITKHVPNLQKYIAHRSRISTN